MNKKNPFVFEEIVTGDKFCGRTQDINDIKDLLENRKNVLLFSKRRYGKTSLIHEIFSSHLDQNIIPIYVDVYDILSANDFAKEIYKEASNQIGFNPKTALKTFKEVFTRARVSAAINSKGELEYTPTLIDKEFDQLIDDALVGLNNYAERKNKSIILALDEFQQIAEIKEKKIDAILRKYVQKLNNVTFIFSGSKRHMLTGLFSKTNAPLYQMATGKELKGIDEKEFYHYACERLNGKLEFNDFQHITKIADNESKLVQHVLYHLHQMDKEKYTSLDIEAAFERILKESDGEHRIIMDQLTLNQKAALKLIILSNGENLYQANNEIQISTGSLQTAVKSLFQNEIIDKERDRYFISGRKFELWCKREFDQLDLDAYSSIGLDDILEELEDFSLKEDVQDQTNEFDLVENIK